MKKYLAILFILTASILGYTAADRVTQTYELQLTEAGGPSKIKLRPPSLASDYTLVLPTTAGTSGYVSVTDGSGVMSWVNTLTGFTLASPTITGATISSPALSSPTISGTTTFSALTANTVPYLNGSKALTSSAVTPTELGYVSGVTSAIQTQLNAKAPSASPTFSGTITTPLTASRAMVTGASSELATSSVTATELGYVSGVTSAIQTQLNAKAPLASPTFTGTVTTPVTASRALATGASNELVASATTATELGYVSGVTSAIQTQLDSKINKSTLTAKGSILTASAASTPAELAAGTDGWSLVADSTAPTGLKWVAPGAAAAGGSNTQVQYNSAGVLGGDAGMTYDDVGDKLTVVNALISGLTASKVVVTDASKNLSSSAVTSTELGYLSGVTAPTGSGALVLATSPTLVTPNLGTPSAATLTNATGLPLTTGVTGTLPIANGGTNNNSAYTAGSLVFSDGSKLTQDNANLFWDDTNKRLGIGTSGPTSKLSITSASNDGLKLTDGTVTGIIFPSTDNTNSLALGTTSNHPIGFFTNNSRKMVIDTSGNVGIGMTPSTWATNNGGIELGQIGAPFIMGQNASALLHIGANYYYDGAYKYKNNGYALDHYLLNGEYVWRSAASGTAGNAITWSERMRIDSSGNVGIGTTPSYRLHATQSASADTVWFSNTNGSFGGTLIRGDATREANSGYYFMGFTSSAGADNEFLFRGDGNAFADGAWGGGGADYAEYFEWADGNPSSEDRRGYSVSLVGNKIKIAEPGETVIGVISGNPSVIGDSFPETREKYLVDDFGSYVKDKDGKRVKNPKFKKVANRKSRDKDPMFSAVGLMGKLRVRKGQEVDPRWIKMRDISPTIEEWLVR